MTNAIPAAIPRRLSRAAAHCIGLVLAALLAYAIFRGYRNPDFLLDLATGFRLC